MIDSMSIHAKTGFTLIEMSIVLVIIGLIVGGILTGQDLISAAAQRAQISQMEKYNTAVHTFQNKYGYLPGDIPNPYASNFGFQSRGQNQGEGDGNGIIEGNCNNISNPSNPGFSEGDGELAVFWVDLSAAGLIDANIPNTGGQYPNTTATPSPTITLNTTPNIKQWLPTAKMGTNNFLYLYSLNGMNYFALSSVNDIGCALQSTANPNITVQQSYNIDKKMDDGFPQSGSVTACYVNYSVVHQQALWAAGSLLQGAGSANCTPTTTATPYLNTNCFDNATPGSASGTGGQAGVTETYSVNQNAALLNCALSFRFQ